MEFYKNRQPIPGISEEELEKAFKAFLDAFTEEWLTKNNYHPLRALWKRGDVLSSNEILSLGNAINEVSKIDSIWLRNQIKLMKSAERNNYLGAFAEVISIDLLNGKNHPTVPAKSNQPGYDALMALPPSPKNIRLSIKNYGQSKHESTFVKWAAKTEELIIKLLKKYKYYPVTVWIDCPSQYPSDAKWKMLHSHLDNIFKTKKNADDPFSALCTEVPEWIVIISPHISNNEPLHPNYNSYTFVLSSVYHQNENDNLLSKIQDACANLTKHSATENDEIKNFLFIHLSPLASITKCKEWLDAYFIEYPEKPISAVLFHQPSVVTNLQTGSSNINHYFFPYIRNERLNDWLPQGFQFTFTMPIGTVSNEPALYSLNFTHPDGKIETISVNDRYMYQRGNHYIQMQPDGKGGFAGNISQLAPGVFSNIVVELPNQPGQAVIAGKFPPSDELLIL
jgi:hypothetical protein